MRCSDIDGPAGSPLGRQVIRALVALGAVVPLGALVPILPAGAAEKLPLYEIGAGIAAISTPHYTGAGERHNLAAPTPYLVYRGEHLRIGRSGVDTFLVDEERLDFSLSLSGNLPVDSDDNRARRDMPDLDPMLEIGPTLRYVAWQNAAADHQLRLDLPLRGAFTVDDLKVDYQGMTASPGIAWLNISGAWRWAASAAAIFGDQRFHEYFYDVSGRYVTPSRAAYSAQAGLTAVRFSLSATRNTDNWFLGGFLSYRTLFAAENRESPLVREENQFSVGIMAIRFFKKSETLVSRDPEVEF